jgi:hypothetical protein
MQAINVNDTQMLEVDPNRCAMCEDKIKGKERKIILEERRKNPLVFFIYIFFVGRFSTVCYC